MIPTNYLRFANKKVKTTDVEGNTTIKSYKRLQQLWEAESAEEAMSLTSKGTPPTEWRDVPEASSTEDC